MNQINHKEVDIEIPFHIGTIIYICELKIKYFILSNNWSNGKWKKLSISSDN